MRRLVLLALIVLTACRIERASSGRPPGELTEADSLAQVEQDSSLAADVQAALRHYYARLTARDWPSLRRTFASSATVTTRGTPPGERTERLWVQTADDFVRRGPEGPGRMAVFNERMLHAHVTGYGDLADAWVVYERRWGPGHDSVRGIRGIGAFHLYRESGVWRIVSLTTTVEVPGRPLLPPAPARHAGSGGSTPGPAERRSGP